MRHTQAFRYYLTFHPRSNFPYSYRYIFSSSDIFSGRTSNKHAHERARMAVRHVRGVHHRLGGRPHIRPDDIHVHPAEYRGRGQAGDIRDGD